MADDLLILERDREAADYKERFDGVVRRVSKNDRTVEFRLSDRSLDRHGTRIEPDGIRTENYAKNPIFLWGHDGYGSLAGPPAMESVIGRAVEFGPRDVERSAGERAFDIKVEFTPEDVNPQGERALRLVRGGFLNTVSIGARVLDWKKEKSSQRGAPDVVILTETELLESSLVSVPSNPNAVALARAVCGEYDALDRIDGEDAEILQRWLHEASREAAAPPDEGADPAAELGNHLIRIFRDRMDAKEAIDTFSATVQRMLAERG